MRDLSKKEIKKLVGIENPILLDIGCYDGKDAAELCQLFKDPTVHCFDADKRSHKLFEKNEYRRVMTLHKMAVCNVDGEVEFNYSDSSTRRHYTDQDSWSASSSIKKPKLHLELFPDVTFSDSGRVRATKLDTWYREHLRSKLIDFVWADVNGAEEDLVLGGLRTLTNRVRYFYTEFSDKECYEGEVTKEKLLSYLPGFEELGTYKFQGNFGNVLLRNTKFYGQ